MGGAFQLRLDIRLRSLQTALVKVYAGWTLFFLFVALCCDFTPVPQRIRSSSRLSSGVHTGYLGLPGSGPSVCRWNVPLDEWGNWLCCCWFSSLPQLSLLLPLSLGSLLNFLPGTLCSVYIFWITPGFLHLGSPLLIAFPGLRFKGVFLAFKPHNYFVAVNEQTFG